MFQCKQGGTATGVEGTAELYTLEGSGEPPSNPLFVTSKRIKQLGIAIEEKRSPFFIFNTATGLQQDRDRAVWQHRCPPPCPPPPVRTTRISVAPAPELDLALLVLLVGLVRVSRPTAEKPKRDFFSFPFFATNFIGQSRKSGNPGFNLTNNWRGRRSNPDFFCTHSWKNQGTHKSCFLNLVN